MTSSDSDQNEKPASSRPPGKMPTKMPSKMPPKKRPGGSGGGTPTEPERRPFSPFTLLIIAGVLFAGFMLFNSSSSKGARVPYSFFLEQLEDKNIKSASLNGEVLVGEWKQIPAPPEGYVGDLEEMFNTVVPHVEDRTLLDALRAEGIDFGAEPVTISPLLQFGMYMIIPLIFIVLLWTMMRRSSDPFSGGMMGGFIRSPARKFEKTEGVVDFDDVAGLKQAKQDLEEVVLFLKEAERFTKLGARIPKGVLLIGPPGTGKTLLARATAGEAGVPFFSINGSEFIQMFVGVGATRVRDLFSTAREASPCIIFIDEIDAVGRVRGAGVGGGHDEREQTLNQILSEMDGFEQSDSVIVLAATNRPDVLDPALLRPGRFDRHVTVEKPTREGRLGILKVHSRKLPLADDVDLEIMAQATIGFSGAEIQKLCNEAALRAAREDRTRVTMDDFYFAHDLVLMGQERDEKLTDDEKKLTAWHEAGHAVIAWYSPKVEPLHKVSIVPRGRAMGVTQLVPEKEILNVSESRMRQRLVMMMGGRAAEKLVYNEYSAGAENDIARATQICRRMVAHWGMSEVVGPVAFQQGEEHPFLGKEMHAQREFSEETARIIDVEVQKLMQDSNQLAIDMLIQYREQLDKLAEALLEHENLDRHQVAELLGPRPENGDGEHSD